MSRRETPSKCGKVGSPDYGGVTAVGYGMVRHGSATVNQWPICLTIIVLFTLQESSV